MDASLQKKKPKRMKVELTRYGRKQMKERLGLPKRAMRRHMNIVISEGLRFKHLNGSLANYISWQVIKYHGKCNNPIVYGHHLYVLNNHTLITVLDLPTKLKPLADKLNQEKSEKNATTY